MFLKLYVKVRVFFESTEGASGIEYAIVAAMVAVMIVGFITPIGDWVFNTFKGINTVIGGAAVTKPGA
ncbi:Flp family type IVb pilin [Pseudomonas sp. LB3P31]